MQRTLLPANKKRRKEEPYYNSIPCQMSLKSKKGTPCKHMAYFALPSGKYVCGQHSANEKTVRRKLVKDPEAASRRVFELKSHAESVERRKKKNAAAGRRGTLTCFRMTMMGSVPLKKGAMNVFPNNKHENRKDGYGCCELSPMRLGPVKHRQPGLPEAENIENYHQFNKVWPCETDEEGNPTKEFRKRRKSGYEDPEPRRHKFDAATTKKLREEANGENKKPQPSYCLHLDLDGEEMRFTYVQSRYFYCRAYEALAKRTRSFEILKKALDDGYDLCICGYDAYQVTNDLRHHYRDPKKPFGHELVLYTLLTVEEGEVYPWRRYRFDRPEVYENVASMLVAEDDDYDE